MTCLMVPSLPAASDAWSTISTEWVSDGVELLLRVGKVGDLLRQELGRPCFQLVFRQILKVFVRRPAGTVITQPDLASSGYLKQPPDFLECECHACSL